MIKLCLVTLSLGRSWPCASELYQEKRAYSEKWGAAFFFIEDWNHEAFGIWNQHKCPREAHFAKLAVVSYYTKRCGQLVYMDDTIRINTNAPNLWNVPDAGIWAPKDIPQLKRKRHTKEKLELLCKSLNANFTCSMPMFNSGLMVLQASIAHRFDLMPHCSTLENIALEDQGYFNALLPAWNDLLKVTSVLQGSELRGRNAQNTDFVHVTRGARQRTHKLCADLLLRKYMYAYALYNQL